VRREADGLSPQYTVSSLLQNHLASRPTDVCRGCVLLGTDFHYH
jgi:hypothetical protein